MRNKKIRKKLPGKIKVLAVGILICLLFFAKMQAAASRPDSVASGTEVRHLHGLTPGKKYKIRTRAYTKKDKGQDAEEKEPVMEGTYTFTATSPDQEVLLIYDGPQGEVRYKLLANN